MREFQDLNELMACRPSGITIDSRKVQAGDLFVALPSVWSGRPGGEQFIQQAIERGATAIITTIPKPASSLVKWVQVENPHLALSVVAAKFYPRQPLQIVAVTGTNGKSSVVDFTYQLWTQAGLHCGQLGTVQVADSQKNSYPGFGGQTTPDALMLHQHLDMMAAYGIQYAAMEASSHALDQSRMDSVDIKVAAFTNLSHEHLDYHPSYEDYFVAKLRLFKELLPKDGVTVINQDDKVASQIIDVVQGSRTITYGSTQADLTYKIQTAHERGQEVHLQLFGETFEFLFPLMGNFQVSNAICALANVIATGVDVKNAVKGLSQLKSVAGRLQNVGSQVFVDFAHTPDALAAALKALRPHTKSRLFVVFGCGGDRDPLKRPVMGQVAADLADVIYVTDDNPRTEDPALIRQEILKSCAQGIDFKSRTEAIYAAIHDRHPGDVILIAGKGHEQGQTIGNQVYPFCDVQVAQQALAQVGGS